MRGTAQAPGAGESESCDRRLPGNQRRRGPFLPGFVRALRLHPGTNPFIRSGFKPEMT